MKLGRKNLGKSPLNIAQKKVGAILHFKYHTAQGLPKTPIGIEIWHTSFPIPQFRFTIHGI